jgi:hypothetical protein
LDVWAELERRGATIVTVPFWGRAGAGGHTDRITLLRSGGEALVEVERWSSRDELCHALEAPIWERFGTFAGHPLIRGEVIWLSAGHAVEIVATRGDKPFQECVS